MSRGGAERGAASLLAVALAAVLMFVTLAVSGVAAIVHTHRRVTSAADLAALAGAAAHVRGQDGCAAAADVARANAARLHRCTTDGSDVVVEAAVDVPAWVAALSRPEVVVRARAGPGERAG